MKSHSPKNGLILCKHDTYIQKITPLDFQAKHFAPVYKYMHLTNDEGAFLCLI